MKKETFYVTGMSCAGCAANVQHALAGREGVVEAQVNFAAATVVVDYDEKRVSPKELQRTVEEAGYGLIIEEEGAAEQAEALQEKEYKQLKYRTIGAIA